MSFILGCKCSACRVHDVRLRKERREKETSLDVFRIIEGKKDMDVKSFVSDIERFVRDVTEDNGNWNGDYRKIADYNKSLAKELEKYLDEGVQSKYTDKYFAKEMGENFADDNYMVNDYVEEIEEKFGKLWKEHGSSKNSRSDKMDKENNDGNLASRMLSTALDDGAEIATRIAAKQLARSVSEPITALLITGLDLADDESTRGKIAKFLTSDIGLGLVSFALSFGVEQLPLPALAQGVVKNLGRELRLQGEMAVADPVVEMIGAPLRMMLTEKVLALPIPGLTNKQLTQGSAVSTSTPITVDTQVIEVKEKSPPKKTKKKPVSSKKKTVKKAPKKSNDSGIKVVVKDAPSSKSDSVN